MKILSMLEQRFHIAEHIDHFSSRYGQLIISLLSIGIIAYLFVTLQRLFLHYVEGIMQGMEPTLEP
jgi:hypothetical protein